MMENMSKREKHLHLKKLIPIDLLMESVFIQKRRILKLVSILESIEKKTQK